MLDAEFTDITKKSHQSCTTTRQEGGSEHHQNSQLWATHSWYMNDSSELEFGREVYTGVIEGITKRNHTKDSASFLTRNMSNALDALLHRFRKLFFGRRESAFAVARLFNIGD